METKRCCTCGEVKPVAEFGKNRNRKDGLQDACKPCTNAAVMRSQQAHPETKRAYLKAHPEAHRAAVVRWRKAIRHSVVRS